MAKKIKKSTIKVKKKKLSVKKKKDLKPKEKKSISKKLDTKSSKSKLLKKSTLTKEASKKVKEKVEKTKKQSVIDVNESGGEKISNEIRKPKLLDKENEIYNQEQLEIPDEKRRSEILKKIKKYSKKDLEHFKKIILDKQNEILEQLQNLKDQILDPSTGEYINENSPYSLHMAEMGTDAMEREKTFLYAQRETKFLSYLEEALKRIEDGTYGLCTPCIDDPQYLCPTCPLIPKERLEAVPHTQLCVEMKKRQEKK